MVDVKWNNVLKTYHTVIFRRFFTLFSLCRFSSSSILRSFNNCGFSLFPWYGLCCCLFSGTCCFSFCLCLSCYFNFCFCLSCCFSFSFLRPLCRLFRFLWILFFSCRSSFTTSRFSSRDCLLFLLFIWGIRFLSFITIVNRCWRVWTFFISWICRILNLICVRGEKWEVRRIDDFS